MGSDLTPTGRHGTGLVDVLDRILEKGLVVAGDIKVSLAEVELLTIRIRLIVCSIDKAQEIGMDWWRHDHHLAPGQAAAQLPRKNEELRARIALLEGRGARRSRAPAGAQLGEARRAPAATVAPRRPRTDGRKPSRGGTDRTAGGRSRRRKYDAR